MSCFLNYLEGNKMKKSFKHVKIKRKKLYPKLYKYLKKKIMSF